MGGLIMEQCNAERMYVCDRCGKRLIDTVDILLLLLVAVNLVFGVLILLTGSWFGVGSFFLAFLFGAGFALRRRECVICAAGKVPPGDEK
jgi:hypothetical protein